MKRDMSKVRWSECANLDGEHEAWFEMFLKEARNGKHKNQSRGLGDTVAKITKATGMDKVSRAYEWITGRSCGCKQRRKALNDLFPYQNPVGTVSRWAVGVTTSPRPDSTIQLCIASLLHNGWRPQIFAEPESDLGGCEGMDTFQNVERLGAWRNWMRMCKVLLDSDAEWIMTVQDDALFAGGVREFLETDLWPSPNVGMVSLYTPRQYTKSTAGCFRIHTRSLWGACAMLFPRRSLELIVNHRRAEKWQGAAFRTRTRPREPWEIANIDTAVGKIVKALKMEMWFYTPSLSQHIAEHSTLGHGGLGGRREASQFAGDLGGVEEAFADQAPRARYRLDGTPQ